MVKNSNYRSLSKVVCSDRESKFKIRWQTYIHHLSSFKFLRDEWNLTNVSLKTTCLSNWIFRSLIYLWRVDKVGRGLVSRPSIWFRLMVMSVRGAEHLSHGSWLSAEHRANWWWFYNSVEGIHISSIRKLFAILFSATWSIALFYRHSARNGNMVYSVIMIYSGTESNSPKIVLSNILETSLNCDSQQEFSRIINGYLITRKILNLLRGTVLPF